jgi:hypothetical protein
MLRKLKTVKTGCLASLFSSKKGCFSQAKNVSILGRIP